MKTRTLFLQAFNIIVFTFDMWLGVKDYNTGHPFWALFMFFAAAWMVSNIASAASLEGR